jgi:copper(I)-binding protein
MLKTLKAACLALLLAAAAPLAVAAHNYAIGALRIGHPWSPPNPPGAPTAAGYLTIYNLGRVPDRLLGGVSPMFGHIEVHEMSMAGGIMRMRPLPQGLVVPPGATVSLAPGGLHLMMIGPRRPFRIGERIPVTLRFERAGSVPVEFYVQAAPMDGMSGMGGMRH